MRRAIVFAISSYSTITTGTRSLEDAMVLKYRAHGSRRMAGEPRMRQSTIRPIEYRNGGGESPVRFQLFDLPSFPVHDASAEHRLLHHISNVASQLDVAGIAAGWVHPVGQHHDEQILLGIDPDRCAGEARVPEAPWREELPGARPTFR